MLTCIIDFLLDLVKPHFYYISMGLMRSVSTEIFPLCAAAANDDDHWIVLINEASECG